MTEHSSDEPSTDEAEAEVSGASDNPLRSSRTSRFWLALAGLTVILLLLIIFVAQNTRHVEVSFLGWTTHPPLAIALLVAAVAGLVIAGTGGTLRIWQLHRRVRRTAS